ncbi:sodium-dependent phosphate transport protein 1 isoform X5 [Rhinolophus sinicus]|uniref:sodium-dependent phosphate transport protein 1 isoform X5 n=1 Tax=Rhinolophus sinicus TaxID=89399 RepID=UPI003D797EB5
MSRCRLVRVGAEPRLERLRERSRQAELRQPHAGPGGALARRLRGHLQGPEKGPCSRKRSQQTPVRKWMTSSLPGKRMCLSLTVVAMVNSTDPHGSPNASTKDLLDNIKNPRYNWSPEIRGVILSSILYGLMLGPFISLLATGFICQALGWPYVFYIFGACGCALGLLWFVLFYDDPKDHPCISVDEKEFITSSLMAQVSSSGQHLPIKAMLKSLPLWAISLGCFAFSWTNHVMFLYSPTFISSKLHVNVTENGMLSALPYLFSWLLGIMVGQVADLFLSRNMLRVITIRKLFTTLGLLLPSFFGICLCHLSFSFHSTIIFLILASSTVVFCVVGILINPLDIAPRYYGFLKGVTVLIGMTGGLTSSTLAGIILNQDPESSWSKIFFLMAAINVISLTFYLIFAKAEIQDWAKEKQHTRL